MTDEQVQGIIEEFRVPLHVRRHCEAVADFAVMIGKKFIERGEPIDLDLLRRAALLHDFMRAVDFKTFARESFPYPVSEDEIVYWNTLRATYKGKGHEEAAAEILRERGFAEVANLVETHRYLQIEKGFKSWEEKILYYADKRTKHDTIVALAERLADGRRRNQPETEGRPESFALDRKIFDLEREVLTKAGMAK